MYLRQMYLKTIISLLAVAFFSFNTLAQDTTVVQTLDYNSTTRDTVVSFPDGTESYRQILMLYNMRCKGARVSTGANRNLGCGEWDYSCNTYITDSSRRDSFLASTKEYTVSGFSGSSFSYSNSPIVDRYQLKDYVITVNNQTNTQNFDLGGSGTAKDLFQQNRSKIYIIYTAAELLGLGMTAGEIDAMSFNTSGPAVVSSLRIQMGQTASSNLQQGIPDIPLKKVIQTTTSLGSGFVNLPFIQPFIWDGTSNLLLEVSKQGAFANMTSPFYSLGSEQFANSTNNSFAHFDGSTYYEASYKGISGQAARSADVWIKTKTTNGEICSWGADRAGEKWVFRINDNGTIRVEVNGGSIYGTTVVNDGEWHHVAYSFGGTEVNDIQLYVDGALETPGAVANRSINTASNLNMRISRGVNNRYFTGEMDMLRVWDKALTAADVSMLKSIQVKNTNPLYANLVAKYFTENSSTTDKSANNYDLTLYGNNLFSTMLGRDINTGLQLSANKPMIRFTRADVTQTIDSSAISFANIARISNQLRQIKIVPKYQAISNDSFDIVQDKKVWQAGFSYDYDEDGNKMDSTAVTADGTVQLDNDLPYYRRFPSSLEIMSFVTPYGIGLDLGQNGKTWVFDVTDFTPILKGDKRMFMSRGGQWQEEMDIKFLFIKGAPEREVKDIVQVWPTSFVTANYNQILANKEYFPPVKFPVEDENQYVIKSAITGHGQQGEFIPRNHTISVDGNNFTRRVWKACANNPVYPQGGTWIYDRAGWCPGMETDMGIYPLNALTPGKDSIEIDYTIDAGEGDSRYIINNQIVTYGPWTHSADAAISDIISPSNNVEHERFNPMCVNPTIEIRNTGADTLTNALIKYWVNNETNAKTDLWQGSLAPGAYITHTLPVEQSIWSTATGTNDKFFAKVLEVNGQADPNDANNLAYSNFVLPPLVPDDVIVFMRSNNAGNETSVKILDDWGQVIYERKSLENNTLYRDTVKLGNGCHQMIISDNDGDGINFWANNDGTGFIRLLKVGGGYNKTFEGDFGGDLVFNFTVNHTLSVKNSEEIEDILLYPNPTKNNTQLHGTDVQKAQISIFNSLGQKVSVPLSKGVDVVTLNTMNLASGIYTVQMVWGDKIKTVHLQVSK